MIQSYARCEILGYFYLFLLKITELVAYYCALFKGRENRWSIFSCRGVCRGLIFKLPKLQCADVMCFCECGGNALQEVGGTPNAPALIALLTLLLGSPLADNNYHFREC